MTKNLFALSGIYQIKNALNGKIYVGSAKNLHIRKLKHFEALRRGKHPNNILQAAYNKYGEENLIFEPLIICDKENLIFYEQVFIDGLNPEYNISKVAGRWSPFLGKHLSKEHKEKISIGSKGHKKSPETKRRMSASLVGNKRNLGKHRLPESIEKGAEKLRGKKLSIEELESRSKLKFSDVQSIRKLLEFGSLPSKLSKLYGVTTAMICRIRDRKAWNF